MIQTILLAFGFLPGIVQLAVLGFLAILVLLLVFKIVAIVLDAIPFL